MKKLLAITALTLVAGGALAGHPSIMSDKAFERQLKSCHTVTFNGAHQVDGVTYTSGTMVKVHRWIEAVGGQGVQVKPFVLKSAPGEVSEADLPALDAMLREAGEVPCKVWLELTKDL